MTRVTLTKTTAPTGYAAAGVALTMTAADLGDGNRFQASGNDLLFVQNTHGATPYTFTITSARDPYNRLGDITTEAIVAGAIKVFGPLAPLGWLQSDGYVYVSASDAAVKFGILAL